jgi:hypothetical protein
VEWAHTIAPGANILLMTTNPAETLGVQAFPAMMNAEQFIVDHHEATVISQSFAAAEETFESTQSLLNLRHAFISAASNGVTVLGSSGDGGTANTSFTPVKNPKPIPFPSVEWPASDLLVAGVGGTYLCTDPATGTGIDTTDPPVNCQSPANPGVREVGWIDSGGGFSHVFAKPSYPDTLPPGSTAIGAMRGVPEASSSRPCASSWPASGSAPSTGWPATMPGSASWQPPDARPRTRTAEYSTSGRPLHAARSRTGIRAACKLPSRPGTASRSCSPRTGCPPYSRSSAP